MTTIQQILKHPLGHLKRYLHNLKDPYYQNTNKRLELQVRNNSVIRVAFILYDISKWKTEELYRLMLAHKRFEPVLVPVISWHGDYELNCNKFISVLDYLKKQNYSYIAGDTLKSLSELVNPDVVFYGEPYWGNVYPGYMLSANRNCLSFCVSYGINCLDIPDFYNTYDYLDSWKLCVENDSLYSQMKEKMENHCINGVVTGSPISDSLFKAKDFSSPWKVQDKEKKKIIWAPHHTIPTADNMFEQSTFLDYADFMLELADRYNDTIQFAFKPHPVLKRKLYNIWGKEKTEDYYNKWATKQNTQLEDGTYYALFAHSDAMIHDSSSFIVEYLHSDKPVLFLNSGKSTIKKDDYFTFAKEALDVHYHGFNKQDIIDFIESVIVGNDELSEKRRKYINQVLIPPHGKSASENIIDAILGENGYK